MGGEPFMHPQIKEIIEIFAKKLNEGNVIFGQLDLNGKKIKI